MIEAYKRFFRNYTNFSGRSTRSDYWYVMLANFLIGLVLCPICVLFDMEDRIYALTEICSLIIFIPSMAIFTRRMHDINRSGWSWLLVLIPIFGPIVLLVLLCNDSDNKNNKYGKRAM